MENNSICVPKASPIPLPELEAYLAPYAPLFRREPTRRSLERYITGLLTDLRHKTCDTIADAVAGTSVERLQHLLTDADWQAEALDEQRVRRLVQASPRGGVLILDDTGLPKQGKRSVGVARQYSGTLGKVGNCQVVVSAEYAADDLASSTPLHWPVTARLYLPERWANDPERRRKAGVPEEQAFQTKPEIALELVDQARNWQVPFEFVVSDAGYGDNPGFLEGLEERQVRYVCGVGSDFGVRLPHQVQASESASLPEYQGKGRPRLPRPAALYKAEKISQGLRQEAWQTITWREGSKGPLCKQFAAVRVHRAAGNAGQGQSVNHSRIMTGPEGWLLAERPVPGEQGDCKWYYSNLPADTPLERLVALAHARWMKEQFYQQAKGECGLRDYQGRRWDGFHRHLALAMLAHSFLVQHRMAASEPAEGAFFPLCRRADVAGSPPAGAHLVARGPCAVAHSHQPDQSPVPSPELTKQY